MFRNRTQYDTGECKFMLTCSEVDFNDEFCFQNGGRRADGKWAECYKGNTWWYNIRVYKAAVAVGNVASGLASKLPNWIIKGFIRAEDADID